MENLYVLKDMEQKITEEFLSKGWGLWVLNKLRKKAARNWHDGNWSGSIESIQNISRFIFCNIHTQTGIISKKSIICLQIFSAAILPDIIKIGQYMTE